MGHPPLEDLLPKSGYSVYKLVRMAAIRAIELADGKASLIESPATEKTATLALNEIRAGRVVLKELAEKFRPQNFKGTKTVANNQDDSIQQPEMSTNYT